MSSDTVSISLLATASNADVSLPTGSRTILVPQSRQFSTNCCVCSSRRSVDQFVLVSNTPLGPMARFFHFLSVRQLVFLRLERPSWRVDGCLIYSYNSAILPGPSLAELIAPSCCLVWESLFVASYYSLGLQWKYSNLLPHGGRLTDSKLVLIITLVRTSQKMSFSL
jgi:hypothetical protein